jgi:hypothetical protein
MKKKAKKARKHPADELRPEYKRSDFGVLVRGKYTGKRPLGGETDRATLHEALRQSDADAAASRLVDAEDVL